MFGKDIGIDLGTANILIHVKGEGIVLNEPSVVAVESDSKKVLAVGEDAYKMLGRTPGKVEAIKPLQDGVIANFELTVAMLDYFIKKVQAKSTLSKPRRALTNSSSLDLGSTGKTSIAAPPICSSLIAAANASISTTVPREALIK